MVVGVEDPDDDPRDAEQDHDREEHAREPDREGLVPARDAEEADDPRRDQDEERAERGQPEQHQPEEARGDAPGALALALLDQLAEDGDERRGQRGVGEERPDEVRELVGDGERVDRAVRAEVVGRDDLANEADHA